MLKRVWTWVTGGEGASSDEGVQQPPAKRARLAAEEHPASAPRASGTPGKAEAEGAAAGLLGSPSLAVDAKALEARESLSLFLQVALELDPVKRALLTGRITRELVLSAAAAKAGGEHDYYASSASGKGAGRRFGGVDHGGAPAPAPTTSAASLLLGSSFWGAQGFAGSRRATMDGTTGAKGAAIDGVCGLPAWSSPAGAARAGLAASRSPAPLFSPPDPNASAAAAGAGVTVLSPYASLRGAGLRSPQPSLAAPSSALPRMSLLSPVISDKIKATAGGGAEVAGTLASPVPAATEALTMGRPSSLEPALSSLQALRVSARAADVARAVGGAEWPSGAAPTAPGAAASSSDPNALKVAAALLGLEAAVEHGVVMDAAPTAEPVKPLAPPPAARLDALVESINKLLVSVAPAPSSVEAAPEEGQGEEVLLLEEEEEAEAEEEEEEDAVQEDDGMPLDEVARRLLVPGFSPAEARRLSKYLFASRPVDFGGSPEGDKVVGRVGGDTVSLQRLQALHDGEWLNDEIINFKIMKLQSQADAAVAAWRAANGADADGSPRPCLSGRGAACPPGARPPVCLMWNSFFLAKLMEGSGQYTYDNVRRWSLRRKVQWAAVEWVVVPVHLTAHWALAVVDIPGKAIHYFDSLVDSSAVGTFPIPAGEGGKLVAAGGRGGPAGHYRPFLEALARWVADDTSNKLGAAGRIATDDGSWCVRVHGARDGVPQQGNGIDCGMFLLCCADAVARGVPFDFSQRTIALRRRKLALEIIDSN